LFGKTPADNPRSPSNRATGAMTPARADVKRRRVQRRVTDFGLRLRTVSGDATK